MGIKRHSEPRPLQLSKRANVFYLEHARVVQQDDRIVYLTQDGGEFEQMFNIPERNTAFLLLGQRHFHHGCRYAAYGGIQRDGVLLRNGRIAAVQCMRHRFYDAAKRVPPDGIYAGMGGNVV